MEKITFGEYVSPRVERLGAAVEQGFAFSLEGLEDQDDGRFGAAAADLI